MTTGAIIILGLIVLVLISSKLIDMSSLEDRDEYRIMIFKKRGHLTSFLLHTRLCHGAKHPYFFIQSGYQSNIHILSDGIIFIWNP